MVVMDGMGQADGNGPVFLSLLVKDSCFPRYCSRISIVQGDSHVLALSARLVMVMTGGTGHVNDNGAVYVFLMSKRVSVLLLSVLPDLHCPESPGQDAASPLKHILLRAKFVSCPRRLFDFLSSHAQTGMRNSPFSYLSVLNKDNVSICKHYVNMSVYSSELYVVSVSVRCIVHIRVTVINSRPVRREGHSSMTIDRWYTIGDIGQVVCRKIQGAAGVHYEAGVLVVLRGRQRTGGAQEEVRDRWCAVGGKGQALLGGKQ